MTGIAKALAIEALEACGGDLSGEALHRVGIPCRMTSVLGRILDDLGCSEKAGQGNLRVLTVSLEEAIRRIGAIPEDPIEEPETPEQKAGPVYRVSHDPHGIYYEGQPVDRFYLADLVKMSRECYPDINGLELVDGAVTYRIYHGKLYKLDDGDMVEQRI